MVKDLTVMLDDTPGTLAMLGEVLGAAGVNIEGISGMPVSGKGMVHVLVEDGLKARQALEASKFYVPAENEVVVLPVEDKPGNLGNFTRHLASNQINISWVYLATSNRLVIGVDDAQKAMEVLEATK